MHYLIVSILLTILHLGTGAAGANESNPIGQSARDYPFLTTLSWTTGPPVLRAKPIDGEKWFSVKDPSVLKYDGKWHMFCTIRGQKRSHAVIYLSFTEWKNANKAKRYILDCHDGYFCAPQVFYFSLHKKWYMICQASEETWDPKYQPGYSTSTDIADPGSWTPLKPMFGRRGAR